MKRAAVTKGCQFKDSRDADLYQFYKQRIDRCFAKGKGTKGWMERGGREGKKN